MFTFASPIASVHFVNISGSAARVSRSEIGSDPHQYFVTLATVANAQQVSVDLDYIRDTLGNASDLVAVQLGFLLGDSTGNGTVNSGDAQQTRNRSGQPTEATNFSSDYNLDGIVNSGDALIVRTRSGQFSP